MASRRTIRTGPPVRGLTDFPEHAAPEHSTQALNVEFVRGGVSTRQGCQRVRENIVKDSLGSSIGDVAVKLLEIIDVTDKWLVVFGFVPRAGEEEGSEQIYVRWHNDFRDIGPTFDQILNDSFANRRHSSRWDSCLFQQLHHPEPDLIVCTDQVGHKNPSVFVSDWAIFDEKMVGVTGINRVATPYHGNVVNPSAYADDPTTAGYSTSSIRARFCRPHEGRLILGHIPKSPLPDPLVPPNARSMIWYSNFGDAMGWPVENIYPAWENDHTDITGLGSWNGSIVVFRESSIGLFRLVGGSPTYKHAVNGRGCIAHATITEDVNGAIVFLASDGIYAFSGSSQLTYLSKHIERTLRGILESQPEAVRGAHATHYQKAKQVWFAFPQRGGSSDVVFVMDYNYGEPAWSMFTYSGNAETPGRRQIGGLAASPNGQSMFGVLSRQEGERYPNYAKMDSGAADFDDFGDPLAVQSLWESGPIEYNTNGVDRWRHLRLALRPMGSHTMTAWWRRDEQAYNDDTLNGQSRGFVPTLAGVLLGAFVLGVDRLGSSEDHSVRVDIHRGGVGRYGRVGVKSPDTPTDTTSPMDIRGFELDVLDKQTRR